MSGRLPPPPSACLRPACFGRITREPRCNVRTHLSKILIKRTGNLHTVSFRLLQWHPAHIRVEELAEFLAFDFDVGLTPTFRFGWRPEIRWTPCSSFLDIVKAGDSAVIQFSHCSVKESLTSVRLVAAKDTISLYHVSRTRSYFRDASLSGHSATPERKGSQFPLAEYTARYWVDHARFQNVPPSTQDGIKRLFDPRAPHLRIWV